MKYSDFLFRDFWQMVLRVLMLMFLTLVVFFPTILSSHREILVSKRNKIYIPERMNPIEYSKIKSTPNDWAINPILPYDGRQIALEEPRLAPPLSQGTHSGLRGVHWLGTDQLGRDVLSMLIYGFRLALITGVIATTIALFFGLTLGIVSGYLALKKVNINWIHLCTFLFGFVFASWCIYWASITELSLEFFIFGSITLLCVFAMGYYVGNVFSIYSRISIDQWIQVLADIFSSIPALMILLACMPLLVQAGNWIVAIIIGLIQWPMVNRFTRAEVIQLRRKGWLRQLERWRMPLIPMFFHFILRAIRAPIIVVSAFSMSAAIISETTISFLGIGDGIESVSWGAIIANARTYYQAWWLVAFPGIALVVIIYFLNRYGQEHLLNNQLTER